MELCCAQPHARLSLSDDIVIAAVCLQNFTGDQLDTLIATKDQFITPGIVQTALEDLGQSMEVGVDGKPTIKTTQVTGGRAGSNQPSKGAIAGAVIGSLAGAALLCAVVVFVLRRRSASQRISSAGSRAASTAGKAAAEEDKKDDLDGATPRSMAGPLAEGVLSSSTSSSSLQDRQQNGSSSSSRLQKTVQGPSRPAHVR